MEKFFSRLAQALKRFFSRASNQQYLASDTMREWLNGLGAPDLTPTDTTSADVVDIVQYSLGAPTEATTAFANISSPLDGPDGPFKTVRGADRFLQKLPGFSGDHKASLSEFLNKASNAVFDSVTGLLPANVLTDLSASAFPKGMVDRLYNYQRLWDGEQHNIASSAVDPIMAKYQSAMKAAPAQYALFGTVVNESTRHHINPVDPDVRKKAGKFSLGYVEFNDAGEKIGTKHEYFDTAAERDAAVATLNQTRAPEERAFATHDPNLRDALWVADLMSKYDSLDDAWKDMYKAMLNANNRILSEIHKSLYDHVEATGTLLTPEAKKSIKKSIITRLAEHGMIDPYFTLDREGEYWISAEVPNKHGDMETIFVARKDTLSRDMLANDLKNQVYQSVLKSEMARGRSQEEAKKIAHNAAVTKVSTYSSLESVDFRRVTSNSAVGAILKIIENQRPKLSSPADVDTFDQMTTDILKFVVNQMPETSILKSLQRRKGYRGESTDVVGAFERRTRNAARQIASLRYKPRLVSTMGEILDHAETIGKYQPEVRNPTTGEVETAERLPQDNTKQVRLAKMLKEHLDTVLNPTPSKIGHILRSGAYIGTMGFNISSGLVETSNLPMIVFPFLTADYGASASRRAMSAAAQTITNAGRHRTVASYGSEGVTGENAGDLRVKDVTLKGVWSIANYPKDSAMGKRYGDAVAIWAAHGQLNRSMLYEALQGSARSTKLDRLSAMSGWVSHTAARFNREVTLLATYDLELARLQKRQKFTPGSAEEKAAREQAAHKAMYVADTCNGAIAAASAARLAKGNIGSVLYMFKKFGITQLYMQAATVARGWRDPTDYSQVSSAVQALDKSIKRDYFRAYMADDTSSMQAAKSRLLAMAAQNPSLGYTAENADDLLDAAANRLMLRRRFWWLWGSTATMAGVRGLPIYGLVSLLYNLFKDDDEDDFDMVMEKAMPDMLLHGGLDATTEIALSKRIGLSDLLFKDPMGAAGFTTFSQTLATAMGGPVFSMGDRAWRGISKIKDGNIERGVEDLLPVAVTNMFLKAPRYLMEGGPKTLRGDVIYGDVGPGSALMQALGFTPKEVSRRMEATSKLENKEQVIKHKVQNLKLRYYNGMRFHDHQSMVDARRDLLIYGRRHPELKINPGTIDKVLQASVKSHKRVSEEQIMGHTFSKGFQPTVRQYLKDVDLEP